ncbi:ribosome recycling factor [Fusobacterium perfoetens]|uniref:ribosome recycling factor n=1 Tax=Fusobacterium perfoetens TaxID=852 RepID=UPI000484BED0|nr:ribosome recycling factor [Fusobacterium perfoetens]MCI6152689.1 ribosome recycling factor [Fusobacterium perfoetens]MDY3237659.1 ribosome recycling factor [Fusobacterium perfoetens]
MSKDLLMKECKEKMEKTIEATKHKFAGIRAGRASVAMLDGIKVEQYGSLMPLNQIGTVSAPEARLLVIDPWDKSVIPVIEKAIMSANIGLTPNNDGRVIRLMVPELTADRRKEYVKLAKKEAEESKVGARNIRKDINNGLRRLQKAEELTDDELKAAEEEVQKLTDKTIKEIDNLLTLKEKEITTV